MLEPLQTPIFQRGLIEVLILSVPAGLLGTWIILRGLAFFSHAVGTAAFPGLVLAGGIGFSPALGALGAAFAFGATTETLARRRRLGNDAVTALALAGFLALGVILASDVFRSGAGTDNLLFGSLFLITTSEIAVAAVAAVAAIATTLLLGARWTAGGFDPDMATTLGAAGRGPRLVLLVTVALTAAAMLPIVGALLVGALFILPAATARLLTKRITSWQLTAIALAAGQGSIGLWLSVQTDLPPGPVIATLSAAVFAVFALAISARRAYGDRGLPT